MGLWTVIALILVFTLLYLMVLHIQARRRIREEKARMSAIFENSAEGMLILDENLHILESNPAAGRILHLEERPAQDKFHFCKICTDESGNGKICDYHSCFLLMESGTSQELSLHSPDGTLISVSVTSSAYTDGDGRLRHLFRIGELGKERREERERIAKMMTHSILQAQENERKRISRELHDGIGQSLFGALLQLDVLASSLEGEGEHPANKRVESLQHTLRQTIEDIRLLSAELRPSVLDDMGLVAALRNDTQAIGHKFGLQVNFSYEGDKSRLPPSYETALYRIAKEALTNAAKYAQTSRVDVTLNQSSTQAELFIQDYGTGFIKNAKDREGVGLYSMEERTESLGGQFILESTPGQGTVIHVKIPIRKGDDGNENSDSPGR